MASVGLVALAGCGFVDAGRGDRTTLAAPQGPMTVISSAFAPGSPIPAINTCTGTNVSPPLQWSGVPSGAQSLALVVSDPDAPGGTFWHWIVFNIDPVATGLDEGGIPVGARQTATRQARNSAGHAAYDGPCPPSGTHHYRFTVYALRSPTTLNDGVATQRALLAIRAKALTQASVVGTFAAR